VVRFVYIEFEVVPMAMLLVVIIRI